MIVDGCLFKDNKAVNKEGGSMYLDCDDLTNNICSYSISNTIFDNSTAKLTGGGIKYNFYKPVMTNVNFTNNNAEYGQNYSSYPIKMKLLDKSGYALPLRAITSSEKVSQSI